MHIYVIHSLQNNGNTGHENASGGILGIVIYRFMAYKDYPSTEITTNYDVFIVVLYEFLIKKT